MGYSAALVSHPLFWLLAASVFVGAAASRLTKPFRARSRAGRTARGRRDDWGHQDQRNATNPKWVIASVLLTLAVICATVGFLQPGVASYIDLTLGYAMGAVAAASFLVLRFRRAVGLPVVILSVLSVLLFLLFLQSIVAFSGETEIAEVTVLSNRNQKMRLEIRRSGDEPVIVEMAGEYFAPIVKVVVFDDYLVFLGSKTWYRFEGVTSFYLQKDGNDYRFRQADTDYYFRRPSGISETAYSLFERNERDIPGIKTVQVDVDLKRVRESSGGTPTALEVYSVRVQNDGGVQIVAE